MLYVVYVSDFPFPFWHLYDVQTQDYKAVEIIINSAIHNNKCHHKSCMYVSVKYFNPLGLALGIGYNNGDHRFDRLWHFGRQFQPSDRISESQIWYLYLRRWTFGLYLILNVNLGILNFAFTVQWWGTNKLKSNRKYPTVHERLYFESLKSIFAQTDHF